MDRKGKKILTYLNRNTYFTNLLLLPSLVTSFAIFYDSYELTKEGLLVALSIGELNDKGQVLGEFLSKAEIKEKSFRDVIHVLAKISPKFLYLIFEIYVKAYCDGQLNNLLPFDVQNLKNFSVNYLEIQGELLNGFMSLSKRDRNNIMTFFS